jgi:diguanylate cyclase (GGDEF)-like protein
MRRISITFRELLARILPLDQLSPTDLARVRDALAEGSPGELERVALYYLERLSQLGAVRRLPDRQEPEARVLRFQLPDALEVIALRYPTPPLPAGLAAHPRALLSDRTSAPASKVRPLLALDRGLIDEEDRLPAGRAELIHQLVAAATDLLDCDSAAFYPSSPQSDMVGGYSAPPGESALLGPWAEAAVIERDLLLVCPDTPACPPLAAAAGARGAGSLAAVRVRSQGAGVTGFLEVRAGAPGFFTAERLGLLDLLAENFASTLTQAARLERLAYVDSLTGIYNRAFFERDIVTEVARARREGKSLALCIADVDDFKRFNTEFGYEAGNRVLAEVAQLLRGGLRPFDSVARWGGEEFALLLSAPVGRGEAEIITQRLRHAVAEAHVTVVGLDRQEHRVRVTLSIGIALFPTDAESPEELWRRANQALLVAKRPPKNQIVFHGDLAPS